MKLEIIKIDKSITKSYFKQSLKYDDIELFKQNFIKLIKKIDIDESEEHNKNILSNFLINTFYKDNYEINTAGRKDLVIHKGNNNKTPVAVIIETKKPSNKSEMLSFKNPNAKALHETIHYFLKERMIKNNTEIKHIIISNIYEWFIFDAKEFEKYFYLNKQFSDKYLEWTNGHLLGNSTEWFYNELAKPYVANNIEILKCNYINLHNYSSIIKDNDKLENKKLINLYKIFSPEHLLKLPFANDYNKIDNKFYNELLYILGLQEIKTNGKKIIVRAKEKNRKYGTIIEDTINILKVRNKIDNIDQPDLYGHNKDEQLFSIALELSITWLNRILFLKLLEGQLIRYNRDNLDFTFINSKKIKYFAELDELFFEVLAIKPEKRTQSVNKKFGNLPYLNSSLFELTELEKQTLQISDLKDRLNIPISNSTILTKEKNEINTLKYLLDFLNAYNFSSDAKAEIQNDNKTIINAAILGLIFEKINGYKDGSFYTPSFITTHISRQTIQKTVVNKFKYSNLSGFQNLTDFEDLKERIDFTNKKERQKANEIINSIKICDPAVGSGHFLVSVLNELIAIKSELKILQDSNKNRIRTVEIKNINDELEIIDYETSEPFQYYVNKKGFPHPEIQNIQKTLFYEKQNLIENCIFGVDINQKSVSICRLRLWIELLKNTFYTKDSEYKFLETLPNIDINIKTGNSLISKFDTGLDIFERSAVKNLIKQYKFVVDEYKKTNDYHQKKEYRKQIKRIKTELEKFAVPRDKDYIKYISKKRELDLLLDIKNGNGTVYKKIAIISTELEELKKIFQENYKNIYNNSFEWALEFPEILTDEGKFIGFDLVVGNPPYIGIQEISWNFRRFYETAYKTATGRFDLYSLFIERAGKILTPKGTFSFIVPGKFLNNKQFTKTRKLITSNNHSVNIAIINKKVFDNAQVNSAIIEYFYSSKNQSYTVSTFQNEECLLNSQVSLKTIQADDQCIFRIEINEEIDKLLEKIRKNTIKIKDIAEVRDGIVAGEIKDILYLKSKKNKNCQKLYFGKNLSQYYLSDNDIWVDYQPKKMMKEEIKRKKEKRPGLWMRDEKIFKREKILSRFVAKKIIATYDNQNRYYEHTLHSTHITDKRFNTKYVLSLFNSKLFEFYYQKSNSEGGDIFPQIRISSIEKLPIKLAEKKEQNKLIKFVDKILSLKINNAKADITAEQTKIDKLIYKLYELTNEEIELVEKKQKR